MLTKDELLEEIALEGRHTFIATGMSNYDEIDHAVEIFKKYNSRLVKSYYIGIILYIKNIKIWLFVLHFK